MRKWYLICSGFLLLDCSILTFRKCVDIKQRASKVSSNLIRYESSGCEFYWFLGGAGSIVRTIYIEALLRVT